MDTTKQETAYHEAGHALVALAVGCPVVQVSIQPGTHLQTAHCALSEGFPVILDDIDQVAVAVAGSLAQGFLTSQRESYPSRSDFALINHKTLEVQEAGYGKCVKLLTDNWHAVEGVAAALLSRNTLTGSEVVAIVQQSADRLAGTGPGD